MRILLVSDIHANLVALEAVLNSAPAHDTVWCLGDVVGYGPAPNECIARLRGLEALSLSGNHDQGVLGSVPLGEFSDYARAALEWTKPRLTEENRAWLAFRVPLLAMPEQNLTLVHASPRHPVWEYIANTELALENFPYFNTEVCYFGHTHRPIAYLWRAADRVISPQVLPENKPYLIQPKLLLNPGSVGQPRDGDPRAAYAILDLDRHLLTHHRVDYDIEATQRAIVNANLPYALAARLRQGI